jgi:hypothetical protein
MPGRLQRVVILLFIFAALLPLKIRSLPGSGPYGVDASYYTQIARHVAEGDGFKTSVSLYHEALNPLPAPARIYPLWPLLLGWAGRVFGLERAANVLPALLYFADLLLLYLLANRIAVRIGGTSLLASRIPIDAGHVVVALFATNRRFFIATSHPYTEGLAFALLFASLLALDRLAEEHSYRWAAAAGAAAGLAYLARSQMLVLIASTIVAFLIVRPRRGGVIAVYVAAVALPVLPYRIYLRSVEMTRAAITSFQTWTSSDGVAEYILDRAPGLLVAFNPWSGLSYFASFGVAAVLVLLALVVAAAELWRDRGAAFRDPGSLAVWAAVLTGLATHAVLLHRHAVFFLPWLFGWRHGLPFILLVMIAAIYLLMRESRAMRIAVAFVVAFSVVHGALLIFADSRVARVDPTPSERAYAQWIDPRGATVLTTNAQALGLITRANYHWMTCTEPPARTREMLGHLPIDYVVAYDRERDCAFLKGLGDTLYIDRIFDEGGQPIIVLARKDRVNTRVR